MRVLRDTIVVEDRLREIFAYLPAIDGYIPVFGCGDQRELNAFLVNKKAEAPYPLIWLVYPYSEQHKRTKVELESITLILAVETNQAMLNLQRIEDVYKVFLYPLLDNIKYVFRVASIMNLSDEYDVWKYPNYSGDANLGEENETIAIWDALKVNFNCTINDKCLKPINS